MIDTRIWGKSHGLARPYPLVGHLVDTAMVAGAVWDAVLSPSRHRVIAAALGVSEDEAGRLVMLWAGLHDLGKILPQFQAAASQEHPLHCAFLAEAEYVHDREGDSEAEKIRHELATNRALPHLLVEFGYPVSGPPSRLLAAQVAQLLGGHHGRYPVCVEQKDLRDPALDLPELGGGGWAGQRREHVTALHALLGRPGAPGVPRMPVELAVVIAGVVIVSDWLASQDHTVEAQQAAAEADGGLGSSAALRAHARRASAGAPALVEEAGMGRAVFRESSFAGLFPEIARPYPLQASLQEGLAAAVRGPGVLLVTAPTGEGKTEAALHAATVMGAASDSCGLLFALPTQATANQMYERVTAFARRNLLGTARLTLLHGSADLYQPYAEPPADGGEVEPRVLSDRDGDPRREETVAVTAGRWLRMRGRGILAPLAVGTIDQALMGVLPLKRNALRHLGLSGKTVVIDEAHAYDAYTHALLLRLLEWLGAMGAPVVLLSATLTGDTAAGLMRAYRAGAGHGSGAEDLPAPMYPGWMYLDAVSGAVTVPDRPVSSVRVRELALEMLPVAHTYDLTVPENRLTALFGELDGVAAEGGCAAVICTTVAEAQKTYEALREHYRGRYGADYAGWDDRSADDAAREDAAAGPRLRLLHARLSAHCCAHVVHRRGRDGPEVHKRLAERELEPGSERAVAEDPLGTNEVLDRTTCLDTVACVGAPCLLREAPRSGSAFAVTDARVR
ncbi:CRISPR-associated endonuclease Cas3'' [Streptomyces iconiensis]|uniref:CRISPR-associated endonuclease Cas3 n=1 Tax=Streptomyces iconiensis TaxID=1384038 RepID=A0ABT6ZNE2_9ACTN|nr:CRISPR-associated endonuclease Cas3'' [Streptomyces iconiensis]MDJ1130570.1 CRISPR-associated endonuclease Cas3'' [Streptomyces iconiensis]